MKKYMFTFLIAFLLILILLPNFSYGDVIIPNEELDLYKGTGTSSAKFKPLVENVAGIIATVGTVVSVAALVIIGIRYMLASVEERAEYKRILIPYVIGAIMVFAMTTIPSIIYNIASKW